MGKSVMKLEWAVDIEAAQRISRETFARIVELGVGVHRQVPFPDFAEPLALVSIRRDEDGWWWRNVLWLCDSPGKRPCLSDDSWDADGNHTGCGAGGASRLVVTKIFGAEIADELGLPDDPPRPPRQK